MFDARERQRLASGPPVAADATRAAGAYDLVELRVAQRAVRVRQRCDGPAIGVSALEQLRYLSHLRSPSTCRPGSIEETAERVPFRHLSRKKYFVLVRMPKRQSLG